MNSNLNSRSLTLADVAQAAYIIAQSYMDDPLCAFMLPRKSSRFKTLQKFFRAQGEISIKHSRGYGVGDPLQGVAYWKLPEQEDLSVSVMSLKKFLPLLFTQYPFGYLRAKAILSQIDALHLKYTHEAHFYLDNIGVLPEARGQGLASKLIRPFLEMADQQKVIVYTDTVTNSNVPFYEHFGFVCMETSIIRRTGLTIWALRRPVQ